MFAKEITFHTDELVDKLNKLLDSNYFKTVRELYIAGGLIGILFERYTDEYSRKGNTKKIFSDALNKEFEEIKYAATIASLIKTKEDDELLMKKAFGDWYEAIAVDNSDKIEIEKYEFFYKYSIAGIYYIYDSLFIDESNDEEIIHANLMNLITEIESIEENTDRYSTIEKAFE